MSFRTVLALSVGLCVVMTSMITAEDEIDRTLRVMSFNIRYANLGDGPNIWPMRREMVAGLLRFHHVDAAGLQEALKLQIDDLAKQLPQFAWVGVGRDDGREAGEFSPIFYRTDRLEPLESGTFWLSPTPDTSGSKGWDAALPRIATWALFRDKRTGQKWYHFNTHFDHQGAEAREESAELLLERMAKVAASGLPVVLTGDLNVREDSAPYRWLVGKSSEGAESWHLDDARYKSETPHYGLTSTWNGFKGLVPGEKIDFVMVAGGVRVLQHGVLGDHSDGRFPSDHFPVLAELEFTPAGHSEN